MKAQFDINGVCVQAHFDDKCVETVLKPLVRRLLGKASRKQGRFLILLAAPSAAGKSTLAAFLEDLSGGKIQALGMDGFHRHQEEILRSTVVRNGETIPMVRVKGAPESFDVRKLYNALEALQQGCDIRFPVYDRRLHDVAEDALEITSDVLLIEGNWLLLDELVWRDLPKDFTIFAEAEEALLKERVIDRRLRTGRTLEEAQTLYEECDGPNIRLCMQNHLNPDVLLVQTADGTYEMR